MYKVDVAVIREILLEQYGKERKDRIIQIAFGVLMAVGGWVLLLKFKGFFWFGLSLPLLLFAAIMLARGVKNSFLAGKRKQAVRSLDDDAAAVFASMDRQRLRQLPKKYRRNILALFGLTALGGAIAGGGWVMDHNLFSVGAGLGLAAHAVLLVGFEMVFVYRARTGSKRIINALRNGQQNRPPEA